MAQKNLTMRFSGTNIILIFWFFFWLLGQPFHASGQVVINEIMAANESAFADNSGDTPDWIELYNSGTESADLTNWFLSDNPDETEKWVFPAMTLEAGAFLLIMASEKNLFDGIHHHTNFALKKSGETLILSNSNSEIQDQLTFAEQETDVSFGRATDGSGSFVFFQNGTPEFSNSEGIELPLYTAQLTFSHQPGHYAEAINLTVMSTDTSVELRYTLDGSIPGDDSDLLTMPLNLNTSNVPAIDISNIETGRRWKKPKAGLPVFHTVRVRAFKNEISGHQILTGTFLITDTDEIPFSLPVVSIVTDKENLFDAEKGIYVKGNNRNFFQRGEAWEREAHFEYFDQNGHLQTRQNIGIRVSGATTREDAQKTLKLFARKEYGQSHFEHPFFGENYDSTFKRLSVRTTMGDWSEMGFTDDFCQQFLLGKTAADHLRRRFVIVLINGEYWGIHSLREHADKHLLARKENVPDDEIDFLVNGGQYTDDGSAEDYIQLLRFLENNSLAEANHFNFVAQQINLDNLMDYNIAQLAIGNADWPNNNVKFWRSPGTDNEFRWLLADLDAALKGYNLTNLRLYFEAQRSHLVDWQDRDWAFFLLGKLLENEDFRKRFVHRMNEFLTQEFSPDKTIPLLNEMASELSPEIQRHIDRWHYPENQQKWQKAIEDAAYFLLRRPDFLLSETYEWLGPNFKIYPNPAENFVYLEVFSEATEEYQLTILNSLGQPISSQQLTIPAEQEKVSIELPPNQGHGIFYFLLENNGQLFVEKVGF